MPPVLRREDFLGQLTPQVSREIVLAMPEEAPLVAYLIDRDAVEDSLNVRVDWFAQSLDSIRTQINGGAFDQNSVVLTVDDGTVFAANDMLIAEATGEVMFVASVAGNNLTVARGVGATSPAAGSVADNAWVRNIGHASSEGTSAPVAKMRAASPVSNYLQHFKKTVELTGNAVRSGTLTEPERARQRQLKFQELLRDMEQAFIFGARSDDIVDGAGKRVFTMDGIHSVIATNVTNAGGALTKAEADAFWEQAFSNTRAPRLAMIGGPTAVTAMHQHYTVDVSSGEEAVGLRIQTFITPFGDVDIIRSWALRGGYAGTAMTFDPDQLRIRAFPNMMPHLREDIQNNSDDAAKDMWQAQVTLEYGSEKTMARLHNVTGAG